jgi:hypothetical protein
MKTPESLRLSSLSVTRIVPVDCEYQYFVEHLEMGLLNRVAIGPVLLQYAGSIGRQRGPEVGVIRCV